MARQTKRKTTLIPTRLGVTTKVSNGDYGSKAFMLEREYQIPEGLAGDKAINETFCVIDKLVQVRVDEYTASLPKSKAGESTNPFLNQPPEQVTAMIVAAAETLPWSNPTEKSYQWIKLRDTETNKIMKQFILDQVTERWGSPVGGYIYCLTGKDSQHPTPGLLGRMKPQPKK